MDKSDLLPAQLNHRHGVVLVGICQDGVHSIKRGREGSICLLVPVGFVMRNVE